MKLGRHTKVSRRHRSTILGRRAHDIKMEFSSIIQREKNNKLRGLAEVKSLFVKRLEAGEQDIPHGSS